MEVVRFPDGSEIELEFDSRSHLYRVHGEIVPSATKVLGIIGKPALVPWSLKMAGEYIARQLFRDDDLSNKKFTIFKSGSTLETLLKGMKGAHRSYSTQAMQIGTEVHAWIEEYIHDVRQHGKSSMVLPETDQVATACSAFLDWLSDHDVQFYDSERKVFSRKHLYTGTLDCFAAIDGKKTVMDFKTSKSVYPEYHLQNGAYAGAMEEMGEQVEQTAVLRLDKRYGTYEAEYHNKTEWKKDFKAFKGALEVYKRIKEIS
jgi:hypothetical protein